MKRLGLNRALLMAVLTLTALAISALAVSATGRAARPDRTLHVAYGDRLLTLDPQAAYDGIDWQILYATCVKLVNYPDSAAPEGSVPVPEAAAAAPTVSPDGLHYTFTVPDKGKRFKFSPPSNEWVTAASFQRAFERLRALDPVWGLYSAMFPDVTGVVADGTQLTVTLSRPDPDIVARLAMPAMCAVPVDTPAVESDTIPTAGPYYVAAADRNGLTLLRRNPNYHGVRPKKDFDEIAITANQPADAISDGLLAGTVDYAPALGMPDPWWVSFRAAHPDQLQVNPQPAINYLVLNTLRLPLALRQAVNYAVNRSTLIQLTGTFAQTPADHIVPPGVPGSTSGSFYPVGGDAARAAALAAGYTTPVQIVTPPSAYRIAEANAIATWLRAIGLTVQVSQVSAVQYYAFLADPTSQWDIAVGGWYSEFLDPSNMMDSLFRSDSPYNYGHVSGYDAAIAAADALPLGGARDSAFAELDRSLSLDAAPLVVLSNPNSRDPFSDRVGCQTFNPAFGIDLAAVCRLK